MLPLLVDEEDIFIFKFWLDNNIQDGMLYRNELFRRLREYDIAQRPQVYHLGCKLSQKALIVLSFTENKCSLWASLRDPEMQDTLRDIALSPLPELNFPSTNTPPP
ncbi:hypothetical protein [Leptolyngbya sp. 'hensonii']|uniref:hypothetical protein n=1 Tax=Leptolyngbya sp. 'hensonii' TaxID=1922337 RepID=UPI001C0D7028|nr:hypothetical protein [Leptolyngbya sp. 'hensonii']